MRIFIVVCKLSSFLVCLLYEPFRIFEDTKRGANVFCLRLLPRMQENHGEACSSHGPRVEPLIEMG